MGDSVMLLKMHRDGKSFDIIKNRVNGAKGKYHMSMLKHWIVSALFAFSLPVKDEENEETNRVSGNETQ
jgi:hypothetical protein